MKQITYIILIVALVIAVNIILEAFRRYFRSKRGKSSPQSSQAVAGSSSSVGLFWRRRYKFIPQVDTRDCGPAALASVAKHYGSDYSLARLRELSKTDKQGTTALGLVEAAK
ncbi:cysteine peptidase family C39 domain-containing protein, partial [Streptococcus sobrinus]